MSAPWRLKAQKTSSKRQTFCFTNHDSKCLPLSNNFWTYASSRGILGYQHSFMIPLPMFQSRHTLYSARQYLRETQPSIYLKKLDKIFHQKHRYKAAVKVVALQCTWNWTKMGQFWSCDVIMQHDLDSVLCCISQCEHTISFASTKCQINIILIAFPVTWCWIRQMQSLLSLMWQKVKPSMLM